MTDERRSIDPESHSLGIVNASMTEDSGFYTCFALNDAGTDEYTVSVQVMDQVMGISHISLINILSIRISSS